jgi:hypothetical protein
MPHNYEGTDKPIIIRDADEALHFAFPVTLARLSFGGLARLGRGLLT